MSHFDFHFHLLFKHAMAKPGTPVTADIEVTGLADIMNTIFGGPFSSQASPRMVTQSDLRFGVIGVVALEHAFINRMFRIGKFFELSKALPLDQKLLEDVRTGKTTYHKVFKDQLTFTTSSIKANQQWNIHLINRGDTATRTEALAAIQEALDKGDKYKGARWFALSIEGGHNLSEVPVHGAEKHATPEETLKRLQDGPDDFMAMNLCHLSYIPEMHLGGFAQGLNKTAQIAFSSEDFHPSAGLGITPLGKKVVRQALTHPEKPVLIDVKHMSLYSRLQYYRYKEALEVENRDVERLPIISSHTGFTFNSISEYIGQQQYSVELGTGETGKPISTIMPNERRIGRTDDWINSGLHANPWTIGLFDEEIVEIMQSGGMIGISLDQRVLGTERMFIESARGKTYEAEHLSRDEYNRLFRDRQMPAAEGLGDLLKGLTPPPPRERHSMLLALHLIHAVRVGLAEGAGAGGPQGDSPWDYLCIGSDFDGLINPINAVRDVRDLPRLRDELRKYLPQADKTLPFHKEVKALRYVEKTGAVDRDYMDDVIDRVLGVNGIRFLQRFANNWR